MSTAPDEEEPSWEIQCVEHVTLADGHSHISEVGLKKLGGGVTMFTVDALLENMAEGTEFFMVGNHSGKVIEVKPYKCSCGAEQVTTDQDDENDGGLDSLPICPEQVNF